MVIELTRELDEEIQDHYRLLNICN